MVSISRSSERASRSANTPSPRFQRPRVPVSSAPYITIGSWRVTACCSRISTRSAGCRSAAPLRTTRQSTCCERRVSQIFAALSEATTSTSSGFRRATIASRSAPGGISSASLRLGREMYCLSCSIASSITSPELTGLAMKPMAPELSARSRESSVDTTQTGMCRVERSAFSRSRIRQPCMSGRKMSSEMTEG